jgi:NCAIR mutase (PurE)-related protein
MARPATPKVPASADLGFAMVDLERQERCGAAEVIFGQGKTVAQILKIAQVLRKNKQPVLISRLDPAKARVLCKKLPGSVYHDSARMLTLAPAALKTGACRVAICAAGTSDLPVAEEAAVTAEFYGMEVSRIYDVGVAGLHRLFRRLPDLRTAQIVIVVAGMEGALPSAVAGLISQPVIAVPTSVGYGASFGGLAALLGMLNSCGSGVTVTNIDNGFGAAFAAHRIARQFQSP